MAVDVAVFAPDLMDRSKIAAAVPGARFVAAPAPAGVVVLDLSRPGAAAAIAGLVAAGSRVVAFGSHVDRELLAGAAADGAEVYARSEFFADVAGIVGG